MGIAQTYYVSPTGNNSNPGTKSQPFATPGYASKQMKSGDTLIILSGTYIMTEYYTDMITPPSGTANKWTVIKGEGVTRPILLGKKIPGDNEELHAILLTQDPGTNPMQYFIIKNLEITNSLIQPYTFGFTDGIEALSGEINLVHHDFIFEDLLIHHIEGTAINLAGNTENINMRRCNLHHTYTNIVSSASHDTGKVVIGKGLRFVAIDSCYFGYSGHFWKGIEQVVPLDSVERPDGFGIELSEGPIEISNSISEHNRGDGFDVKSRLTYIHNCISANNYGDGVKLWGDSSKVVNTLIYGNGYAEPSESSLPVGGWVQLVIEAQPPHGYFELTNVSIYDGSTPDERGAYTVTINYYDSSGYANPDTVSSTVLIRNCIFQGKNAPLTIGDSTKLILQDNIIYITGRQNGIPIVRTKGEDEIATFDSTQLGQFGDGNIYADPQFIQASLGSSGNYHLRKTSPAIDKGISGNGIPTFDLEYSKRPKGKTYDIGCYEFDPTQAVERISDAVPKGIILNQNYPNPASDKTMIQFSISDDVRREKNPSRITLKLFDIMGRETGTIVDDDFSQGVYSVSFDVSHLHTGTYFIRMQSNNSMLYKKFIVQR